MTLPTTLPEEEEVFQDAIEIAAPVAREDFLRAACRDDAPLRRRIDKLLNAHAGADADGFLEPKETAQDGLGGAFRSTGEPDLPFRFGNYELEEKIAHGTMGLVYRARQTGLNRTVVLKMVPGSILTSSKDVARFRAEAEATAALDHPHIIPVYEVGEIRGQQFYSMKFVPGGSLADRLKTYRTDLRAAVELLAKVTQALHAAHQGGIIHRDVKPGNILIDEAGEPHLGDFGLAKNTSSEEAFTLSGQIIGTPHYMAPEQASLDAPVTTLADVYAIGAILYELLTGRPPFQGVGILAILGQLRNDEVIPPSKREPLVDRDLEVIALKCLEKDPVNRYQSARSLAEEFERWLQGEPIRARPVSRLNRTIRWARRSPGLAALSGLAAVLFLILAIGGPSAAVHQTRLRIAAGESEMTAIRAGQREKAARETMRRQLYASEMRRSCELADRADGIQQVVEILKRWTPDVGDRKDEPKADLRGWEWHFFDRLTRRSVFATESGRNAKATPLWRPGSDEILVRYQPASQMELWNWRTGNRVKTFPDKADAVTWLNHDQLLIVGKDHTEHILDPDAGTLREVGQLEPAPGHTRSRSAWDPERRYLAFTDNKGRLRVWNRLERAFVKAFNGIHFTRDIAWCPDGRRLAFAGLYNGCQVWDSETGQLNRIEPADSFGGVEAIAWHPDQLQLAITSTRDRCLRVWELPSRKLVMEIVGLPGKLNALSWSPDSRMIAGNGDDRTVRIWSTETGVLLTTLTGDLEAGHDLDWSSDGRRLVSGSRRGGIRVWDVERELRRSLLVTGRAQSAAWSPDGAEIAVAGVDQKVGIHTWNIETGMLTPLPESPNWSTALEWNPVENKILSGTINNKPLKLYDLSQGDPVLTEIEYEGAGAVYPKASWSPDGNWIALARNTGIEVIAYPGENRFTLDAATGANRAHWSRDSRLIAQSAGKNRVRIVDLESRKVIEEIPIPGRQVHWMDWSPDDNLLAIAWDSSPEIPSYDIGIWDSRTGDWAGILKGHTRKILSVSWSPDGTRLASGGNDETVRIWDMGTHDCVAVLRQHDREIRAVAWSPDGTRLLSLGLDQLRVWEGR